MINKCIFFVMAIMMFNHLEAEIHTASSIEEVSGLFEGEAWVLIDLDNTLFEASQSFGHAEWFYALIQKDMQQGLTKAEAIEKNYPLWTRVQNVCRVQPIEQGFVKLIERLQSEGGVVMGLTHRQPVVSSATIRQVTSLGVDFTKTAPAKGIFAVPANTPSIFKKGVLFVGDMNDKGDVFLEFLKKVKQTPKKVIFIDDKRKNVEALVDVCEPLGIDYVGIHYTAIEQKSSVYDPELAEIQAQFFHKILSNEQACLLRETLL